MGTTVKEKMQLNIDKSSWKLVKFGDVVFEPKAVAKNLQDEGIQHIVGLEHIDAEDIHLKRFASIEESTTFTKKFAKGDVLFGRRRAYLKKAAQAPFGGICSGDITVFRAKNDLLPALLPFVVNNAKFFDYAIKHSAGGLSPRVKFKDLANYSFLLPPKDQQAQLAELLWAMDEVVEKEVRTLLNLKKTFEVQIEEEIHGVKIKGKTIQSVLNELKVKQGIRKLTSVGEILKGKGIAKSEVIGHGIPCVRYGELYTKHHRIIRQFYSFIDQDSANKSFKLQKNDILFAGSGETITEIGKSAAFIDDFEAYVGGDTLVFRSQSMDGVYLGYLMNSLLVRYQLNKYGTGATVMHIYPSDLKMIKIPNQTLSEQKLIGNRLELIASNLRMLESQITASKALQKSLINQIF